MPDPNNPLSYLDEMTEDELLGSFTPFALQQQQLEQQMQRAQALRNAPFQRHSTGLGAALGGLGTVISNTAGALGEKATAAKQGQLSKDMQQEAFNRIRALLERRRAAQAMAPQSGPTFAPPLQPPPLEPIVL